MPYLRPPQHDAAQSRAAPAAGSHAVETAGSRAAAAVQNQGEAGPEQSPKIAGERPQGPKQSPGQPLHVEDTKGRGGDQRVVPRTVRTRLARGRAAGWLARGRAAGWLARGRWCDKWCLTAPFL